MNKLSMNDSSFDTSFQQSLSLEKSVYVKRENLLLVLLLGGRKDQVLRT